MSAETTIFEKKLIVCVIALAVTALMMWTGKIAAANYENVYVWVCGVFVLGQASSDWAQWFLSAKSAETQVK